MTDLATRLRSGLMPADKFVEVENLLNRMKCAEEGIEKLIKDLAGSKVDLSAYSWWGNRAEGMTVQGDSLEFKQGNLALKPMITFERQADGTSAFRFNYPIYSTGEVSAYGKGAASAGEGGGGGLDIEAMWDVLGSAGTEKIDKSHLPSDLFAKTTWVDIDGRPLWLDAMSSKPNISAWTNDVGYITDAALTGLATEEELKNYVTIGTAQTVIGIKEFQNGFTIGGITFKKVDGAIEIDGDVYATGEVSAYGKGVGTQGGGGVASWREVEAFEDFPDWLLTERAAKVHTHTWNDIISGKPTTLAGYGITDAYISDNTITLGGESIDVSALAGNYLKKNANDFTTGYISFLNGIYLGGSNKLLDYDSEKDAFCFHGNLYATGEISAYGRGAASAGGGGGVASWREITGLEDFPSWLESNPVPAWLPKEDPHYLTSVKISWDDIKPDGGIPNDDLANGYISIAGKGVYLGEAVTADELVSLMGLGTWAKKNSVVWSDISGLLTSNDVLFKNSTQFDGNAATATKASQLTNARTLWGQSFDGTADVSGDMTSVGDINMINSKGISNCSQVLLDSHTTNPPYINFQVSNTIYNYAGSLKCAWDSSANGGKFTFDFPTINGQVAIWGSKSALTIGNWKLISTTNGLQLSKSDGTAGNFFATGEVSAYGSGEGGENPYGQLGANNTWLGANTFKDEADFDNTVVFSGDVDFGNRTDSSHTLPSDCDKSTGKVTITSIDEIVKVLSYLLYNSGTSSGGGSSSGDPDSGGTTGGSGGTGGEVLPPTVEEKFTEVSNGGSGYYGFDDYTTDDGKKGYVSNNKGQHSSTARMIIRTNTSCSLWYKVSSESRWDYLQLTNSGGTEIFKVSGVQTEWREAALQGNTTYTIIFYKDSTDSDGDDCGWWYIE